MNQHAENLWKKIDGKMCPDLTRSLDRSRPDPTDGKKILSQRATYRPVLQLTLTPQNDDTFITSTLVSLMDDSTH